jgi:penicillin-binding protein 1C
VHWGFKLLLKALKWLFLATIALLLSVGLIHIIAPISLKKSNNCSSIVYDRENQLLYATTNKNDIWRFKTNIKEIDPLYLKMLINYEDKNFYSHHGVDIIALIRATFQYIKNGHIVSGGSTITMQLAKLLEPKKRTIRAKITEILRAIELELFYSKDEILSAYLTLAPYGGNVESIGAASWRYFGKLPKSLSASEAAILVALPQAPEKNRPDKNAKRAKLARDKILKRTLKAGIISKTIYQKAINKKLTQKLYQFPRLAPHLCQKITKKRQISKVTIDKNLQIMIQEWAKFRGEALPKDVTIAALVANNYTGEILAYLGSHYIFSKKTQGYIDMTQAIRSPGSTLKPFIYGLGFRKHIIAPLTIIDDSESIFSNYKPSNFDKKFRGEVTIEYALRHSLNIPAVKVLQSVKPNSLVELLEPLAKLKIPKNRASLSLALGGVGVSMYDLTKFYTALANDGIYCNLHYNYNTKVTKSAFLDKKSAREVNSILQNVKPPDGFVNSAIKIAFKTGTSYGYRDFWTVAYTKKYSVALLVAKPNGKPMLKSSGREAAAPLAFEVMGIVKSIYKLEPWGYKSKDYLQKPPKLLQYFDKKDRLTIKKFSFSYPKLGARYRSANCKDVKVKALIQNGKEPYVWYIDGKLIDKTSSKIAHYFDTGAHTITALDSNGDIISRDIWVDKPDCIER